MVHVLLDMCWPAAARRQTLGIRWRCLRFAERMLFAGEARKLCTLCHMSPGPEGGTEHPHQHGVRVVLKLMVASRFCLPLHHLHTICHGARVRTTMTSRTSFRASLALCSSQTQTGLLNNVRGTPESSRTAHHHDVWVVLVLHDGHGVLLALHDRLHHLRLLERGGQVRLRHDAVYDLRPASPGRLTDCSSEQM